MKMSKLGNSAGDGDDDHGRGLRGRRGGNRAGVAARGALLRPRHRTGQECRQGEGVPLGRKGDLKEKLDHRICTA